MLHRFISACFDRAHQETAARVEKGSAIKELDDRVVGLRREIGKGRDTLAEFMTFQTFLYSLSPEHWRLQQEEKRNNGRYGVTDWVCNST